MQRIPRRQFTDEFQSQAVALAESIGPAKAARQLDMSVKTLANWLITAARFRRFRAADSGRFRQIPGHPPFCIKRGGVSPGLGTPARCLSVPMASLGYWDVTSTVVESVLTCRLEVRANGQHAVCRATQAVVRLARRVHREGRGKRNRAIAARFR